ncbi:MAG: N-acetylmuramoyl-L-alanine amidase, partial [Bacteroidota bacterium]
QILTLPNIELGQTFSETLHGPASHFSSPTTQAPFYTLAAVWQGSGDFPPPTQFRYLSDQGIAAEWQDLQPDPHAILANGDRASQLIILPEGVTEIQLRLVHQTSANWPESLLLDLYAPDARSGGRASATPSVTRSTADCSERPLFQSRTDWGCPDGQLAPNWWPGYYPVSHLVVHHTATATPAPYEALVSSIWQYHTNTLGWGDIGYNWLIAPDGTLYEGRAGGNHVAGGHMCARNSYTMGVGLLGDFTNDLPSDTAVATLRKLLNWKSHVSLIDPDDSSIHVRSGRFLPHIIGHRDGCAANYTECPGQAFYPTLSSLRDSVAVSRLGCTPITPDFGDVFVTSRSLSTSSVEKGGSLELEAEFTYVGVKNSFSMVETSYYLSTDQVFDAGDLFLVLGGLALSASRPAAVDQLTATIPTSVTPGEYYLLFVADPMDLLAEEDERNNYVFRPISVTDNTTSNLQVTDQTSFRVYPLPLEGTINLEWGRQSHPSVAWKLYDWSGRTIAGGFTDLAEGRGQIGLDRDLPSGMYFLELRGPQGVRWESLIK